MRKVLFALTSGIAFFSCGGNSPKEERPIDSMVNASIVAPTIDSSKKSNFHYFANGEAAPDYNKSINDFKAFLAKKTGSEVVERMVFTGRGDSALVVELYNKSTGDFLGFSGDTSEFNFHKLKGEHLTKRLKNLIVKFGTEDAFVIHNRQVSIGMSPDEAIESWGKPNDINKTISGSGTHEQWVYDGSYLYFENGKLTTIQD